MNTNIKNYFYVNKEYLIMIAGIIWIFAATMIIKTGFPFFIEKKDLFIHIFLAIITFMIFYFLIFSRLVNKHTKRILNNKTKKMFILKFFDLKSYIIMFLMMTCGYFIRKFGLLPHFVVGFFYIGLGCALFLCGIKFLYRFIEII